MVNWGFEMKEIEKERVNFVGLEQGKNGEKIVEDRDLSGVKRKIPKCPCFSSLCTGSDFRASFKLINVRTGKISVG